MRASLRATYLLDLTEILETRSMSVSDLTDYLIWLPAGSPLWQDIGGPASLTGEERMLRVVEYRLRDLSWMQAGGKKAGKRPEPPQDPPYAHERRTAASTMGRKAAAYLRRHQAPSRP